MQIVDLFNVLAISCVDPRAFDTHFGFIVHPFPYIGEASRGDRIIANFGEATGNNVRRRQDAVVAADGLQLVQTQSGDIVSGRDDGEGLWNLFRKLEGAEGRARTVSRKSTNRVNSDPWRPSKYGSSLSLWIKCER